MGGGCRGHGRTEALGHGGGCPMLTGAGDKVPTVGTGCPPWEVGARPGHLHDSASEQRERQKAQEMAVVSGDRWVLGG